MRAQNPRFWGQVEMLVMAVACGTVLGTGLLVGAISFQRCDVAIASDLEPVLSPVPALPFVTLRKDQHAHYRARVIINGVPLDMIVDTGVTDSFMSMPDARRVFRTMALDKDATTPIPGSPDAPIWRRVESLEITGRSLLHARVAIMPAASVSVIGLDWLSQLGPVLLDPV